MQGIQTIYVNYLLTPGPRGLFVALKVCMFKVRK